MRLFTIIFAIFMLILFWGGFVLMLFYSIKLKKSLNRGNKVDRSTPEEEEE